jgi:tetratricopeptide (TPR) repeat protein
MWHSSAICPRCLAFLAIWSAFLFAQRPCCAQSETTGDIDAQSNLLSAMDQHTLQRALSAYDRGSAQEAESLLRVLVRRYPANFTATETLGLINAERGDVSSAITLLKRACTVRPSSALAFANLGTAYMKEGNYEGALPVLERAASLDAANPRTEFNLGETLVQVHRFADAAEAFRVAARVEPNNPDLIYNWALALFYAGNSEGAFSVLDRFPGQSIPAQVEALLGDIQEKGGHFEQAVRHFKKAASLDPSEQNIFALGREFAVHWSFNAAIEVFAFGMARYPESSRLRMGLGVAKYGNSDYAGAAQSFSLLLARDKDNTQYADLLGRSCALTSEQDNSACGILVDYSEWHPQDAQAACFAAANILHRPDTQEELNLARRLLDRSIADDPELARAHFEMGMLDQKEMHWQESIVPLERAVTLAPEFAEAHYRLARAYAHVGKNDEANREIAIHEKLNQKQQQLTDGRLKAVTTFLVTSR